VVAVRPTGDRPGLLARLAGRPLSLDPLWGVWIVTYDGDAIIGSPKAWVQSGTPFLSLGSPKAWVDVGAFFLFWGSLALTGIFGVLATYYRFFRRPIHVSRQ
jgi:hypothetical protein